MKFDCLKYRFVCAAFALALVIASAWAYRYYGGFNYSVDFTGGTQVLLKFDKAVGAEAVKALLAEHGWKGADTRSFAANEVLVRVQEFSSDVYGVGEKIRVDLQKAMPGSTVSVIGTDSVSQGVGGDLRWNAVKAVAIALLLMLLYVGVRFQFAFSVGAVTALVHDALVIAAFFLLTRREISIDVIGAILATLGYSVNDTIVIFTKIRENLKKMRGASLEKVINVSIMETMRRTLLTSFSTGLVVCSLIVFGGEILRNLSITLLLGIIFGTYSSIFIASPIMLLFYKRTESH